MPLRGLLAGAPASCLERGHSVWRRSAPHFAEKRCSHQEHVRDALSSCGQDLGDNWPQTWNRQAFILVCAVLFCALFCMMVVFEAQQNPADAVSFGHVDGASSCSFLNSHSGRCQGGFSFVSQNFMLKKWFVEGASVGNDIPSHGQGRHRG